MSAVSPESGLLVAYPLPAAIAVLPELSAAVTSSNIAGRDARIHMPRACEEEPLLLRPPVLDGHEPEPEYSDGVDPDDERATSPWGYPLEWEGSVQTATYAVTRIVAAFDAVSVDESEQILEDCITALPLWFSGVKDWCEVVTKQDLDHAAPRQRLSVLGGDWEGWFGFAPVRIPWLIQVDLEFGEPLDLELWTRISASVGRGRCPVVEHTLLRDARAAHARESYRRAVIDASTSFEIALSRLLMAECRNSDSPVIDEFLRISNRWTLGRLLSTVQNLTALPGSVREDLVEIRNSVIHREAKDPSVDDSERMIRAATDTVMLASPMELPGA